MGTRLVGLPKDFLNDNTIKRIVGDVNGFVRHLATRGLFLRELSSRDDFTYVINVAQRTCNEALVQGVNNPDEIIQMIVSKLLNDLAIEKLKNTKYYNPDIYSTNVYTMEKKAYDTYMSQLAQYFPFLGIGIGAPPLYPGAGPSGGVSDTCRCMTTLAFHANSSVRNTSMFPIPAQFRIPISTTSIGKEFHKYFSSATVKSVEIMDGLIPDACALATPWVYMKISEIPVMGTHAFVGIYDVIQLSLDINKFMISTTPYKRVRELSCCKYNVAPTITISNELTFTFFEEDGKILTVPQDIIQITSITLVAPAIVVNTLAPHNLLSGDYIMFGSSTNTTSALYEKMYPITKLTNTSFTVPVDGTTLSPADTVEYCMNDKHQIKIHLRLYVEGTY
jgi:hypothetical protein